MPAMLDVDVDVGPGDACRRASKFYSLVLELNRPSSKYTTNRMSHLCAGVVYPLVKTSPLVPVNIETN
jgi:hypothetical protein